MEARFNEVDVSKAAAKDRCSPLSVVLRNCLSQDRVELRAVAGREAREKITQIKAAGPLELAAVTGLLEQLRIDQQVDR